MRVFKTKVFARFARKEGISDPVLLAAIRAAHVNPDADLGGGVIKQRVARPNQGKSGGYRTIILYREGERAFFVYGFPKNSRDNIDHAQLSAFKKLAPILLNATEREIESARQHGEIVEITHDERQRST